MLSWSFLQVKENLRKDRLSDNVVFKSSAEGVSRRDSPLYGNPKYQQGNPADPLSVHILR
jgi:hypothetical protein